MTLIQPADLVDIQALADQRGVHLRHIMVYGIADHPLNHVFKEAIYRPRAKMWVHKDLAEIVLLAAERCWTDKRLRFVLLDCLRTTDAQRRMGDTAIVRANPHWTTPGPGQLLSNPGEGAHPRAMAIDIMLEREDGTPVDMGTIFDHFTLDPSDNPAARDYPMPADIQANRDLLNQYMVDAAETLGRDLWLLPSEWWDFRFKPEIYNAYAPLSDADLPDEKKMVTQTPADLKTEEKEFYPALDILRGLCALEVFIWHVFSRINTQLFLEKAPLLYTAFWRFSEIAILAFFVMSGFVVSNSLKYYKERYGGRRYIPLFYAARALRIWSVTFPVALVACLTVVAYKLVTGYAGGMGPRYNNVGLFPASALGYSAEWLGGGWTLPFELMAYSLLPIATLVRGKKAWMFALLFVAVGMLHVWFLQVSPDGYFPLGTAFVAGVLIFHKRKALACAPLGAIRYLYAALFLGVALVFGHYQTKAFEFPIGQLGISIALFLIFLNARPVQSRMNRALIGLGACSYSMYLWHWPIMWFGLLGLTGVSEASTPAQFAVLFGICLPVVAVATAISYLLIERRARLTTILKKHHFGQ